MPISNMAAGVPTGTIAMWHGLLADIPAGWSLCDGTGGTPNLLARFVEGVANDSTNPGATGGASTVALSIAQMPAHLHTFLKSSVDGADKLQSKRAGANDQGTTDTSSVGSGTAHENKPLFYDVAFIMKG